MNFTDEEMKQLLQESDNKKKRIIEQCRKGDRRAFNQFIREHQDNIFSHVRQMVGVEQALNVTRDIFVEAYRAFSHFHEKTSVDAWLFKIAERHIQSASGKRKRLKWQNLFCSSHKAKKQEKSPELISEPESISKLLIAYMDGELSELDTKRVEKQLEKDPDYRREFKKLQQTDSLLRLYSQQQAPPELRVHINAKLDEKTFLEKVYAAVEMFRAKAPERRLLSNPQIAAAAFSIMLVFSGILVYQYNQIQIQRIRIHELEIRGGALSRSGDTFQEFSGDAFVILTGKLRPQTMSLKEVREAASMASEPAHTEFPFIPGDIEKIGILVKERINAMRWKILEDRTFEKDGLRIRKVSAEVPENSLLSFSRFLHQLQEETEPHSAPIAVKTSPVEIYIIDKR